MPSPVSPSDGGDRQKSHSRKDEANVPGNTHGPDEVAGDLRSDALPIQVPAEEQPSACPADFLKVIYPPSTSLRTMRQHTPITEFLKLAAAEPHIYLRNASQYVADAMSAYGVTEKDCYGRTLPHFGSLEADWLPQQKRERKVPRGLDETAWRIHEKLLEGGRCSHLTQGILLRSMPGCGKESLLKRILETVQDYSARHPEGIRQRLAFRFDSKAFARKITGFDLLGECGGGENDDFIISSPTNCNPVFLLPSSRMYGEEPGATPRELFLETCCESGETVNVDFILDDYLDPTSREIFNALLKHYDGNEKQVLQEHVVAERYTFNADIAEGIYNKLPYTDVESQSRMMDRPHPLRGEHIPAEIELGARRIPVLSSPLLSADVILFEDMFSDNPRDRSEADLSRHGHLLAYLETGELQLEGERPIRVKKDAVVFASTNDSHLQAKKGGKTWNSLSSRFFCIAVPAIRQYHEEMEAQRETLRLGLPNDTSICPHTLETLCLFLTATRMLNPQKENYAHLTNISDDRLGELAEKLRGIRKALFFQSPEIKDRNLDLNSLEKWSELSPQDISVLRENEWQIAHEYLSDMNRSKPGVYDGGFGISTRDAKQFVAALARRGDGIGHISVLDTITLLQEEQTIRFEYFSKFNELRSARLLQLYREFCEDEQLPYIDPETLKANSDEEKYPDQNELLEKAEELIASKFPVSTPDQLVEETSDYAKFLVERDFRSVLFPEEIHETVIRYIFHIRAQLLNDTTPVPPEYRCDPLTNTTGSRTEPSFSEAFIDELEKLFLDDDMSDEERAEHRTNLLRAYSSWHERTNKDDLKLGDLGEKILKFDEANKIAQEIRKSRKEAEHAKIYKFWNDSQAYYCRSSAEEDSPQQSDPATRTKDEKDYQEWSTCWRVIEKLGYPPESILKHYSFVFREIIRAQGKKERG